MELLSAVKKSEITKISVRSMELENIIINKLSKAQNDEYSVFSRMKEDLTICHISVSRWM